MKTLIALAVVSGFALASTGAFAADFTDQDRSELRQRAEAFQAERARNPNFQPGEGRLSRQTADLPPREARGAGKGRVSKASKRASKGNARASKGKTETRRQKASRKVKNIPGAIVR